MFRNYYGDIPLIEPFLVGVIFSIIYHVIKAFKDDK